MRKLLTAAFTLCLAAMPLIGKVQIFNLPSIDYIDNFVSKDCLIAFDVGHTLIEGAASWGHARSFRYAIEESLRQGSSIEEAIENFFPKWVEAQRWCPHKAVEVQTASVIKRLRQQGVKMMGLTHRPVEAAARTIDQLLKLGIDFEEDPIWKGQVDLNLSPPVCYLEGVLFCSYYHNKGTALLTFLVDKGLLPERIVIVDDNRERLEAILEAFQDTGLNAYGLHYLYPERHPTAWDAAAAQIQERLQGSLLSDEEAALLLRHKGAVKVPQTDCAYWGLLK